MNVVNALQEICKVASCGSYSDVVAGNRIDLYGGMGDGVGAFSP